MQLSTILHVAGPDCIYFLTYQPSPKYDNKSDKSTLMIHFNFSLNSLSALLDTLSPVKVFYNFRNDNVHRKCVSGSGHLNGRTYTKPVQL